MNLSHSNKQILRKQTLTHLKSISSEEKQAIESKLMIHLCDSPLWKDAETIGITCATDIEWDTIPIIKCAWKEGKRVSVPKTIPKHARMEFYRIDHLSHLEIGFQNILEPIEEQERLIDKSSIDLLIVPGVVFDEYGYRIGFGGGYYDRFLTNFQGQTISLLSTLQLVAKLPIEKHDLHVQYLITEKGICKVKDKSEV